jgi:hypothetical protein
MNKPCVEMLQMSQVAAEDQLLALKGITMNAILEKNAYWNNFFQHDP